MVYRIAAIGLGGLTSEHVLPALADMDDVAIAAGVDIDEDAGTEFEQGYDGTFYTDHYALLDREELDGVYIATPHSLHHEQATDALEAGVDVLLEKPMVTAIDDAVDLVATADDAGRTLAVGYQRHFDPAYKTIRDTVADGTIGEPHTVSTYLEQDWYDRFQDTWRTDPPVSGGGELYDSGSHLLDAVLWTTGTEPATVTATMEQPEPGVDVNTAIAATLDPRGGGRPVTASISVTGDGRELEPGEEIRILGSDGQIHFDGETLTVDRYGAGTDEHTFDAEERSFRALTEAKLDDFLTASEDGGTPAVPGTYGVQVTAMTEAAYTAHETGETVDVDALLGDDA